MKRLCHKMITESFLSTRRAHDFLLWTLKALWPVVCGRSKITIIHILLYYYYRTNVMKTIKIYCDVGETRGLTRRRRPRRTSTTSWTCWRLWYYVYRRLARRNPFSATGVTRSCRRTDNSWLRYNINTYDSTTDRAACFGVVHKASHFRFGLDRNMMQLLYNDTGLLRNCADPPRW